MEDVLMSEDAAEINPERISREVYTSFNQRYTVRAIVKNTRDDIALIHITKEGRYKLPGGGIESGESPVEALIRECKEEIGAHISGITFLGHICEIKGHKKVVQYSHCYSATASAIGNPILEPEEESRGFTVEWMSIIAAIDTLEKIEPRNEEGTYVRKRDLKILNMALDSSVKSV
ncbi:NUDIX domain-containing protein [Patescibacteria group bacterium]|nr:NUDIX domain-containing protein [Patescibacteria group bacterium]